MSYQIPHADLVVIDADACPYEDGRYIPRTLRGEERTTALLQFRRTGEMRGLYFKRMGFAHENDEEEWSWGPESPAHVDWTGFDNTDKLLTWHADGSYTLRKMYDISEGDHVYDTIEADDVGEALGVAIEGVSRSNYDAGDETLFIEVRACNVADASDRDTATVTLPPDEPRCSERKHAWTDEKVRGHGGGVVIRHTCAHCAMTRTVDTWAHDPSTGEQGLTSTRYDP